MVIPKWYSLLGVAGIIVMLTVAQAADRLQDRRGSRPSSAAVTPATSSSTNSTVLELLRQLDTLQAEVRELRNQVEIQQHQIKRLNTQQTDLLRDIDKRLVNLEGGRTTRINSKTTSPLLSAPAARPGADKPPTGKTGTASRPAASTVSGEQKEYDKAFGYMKKGQYKEATRAFRGFLNRHPGSKLASNAQYWVAEANYVVRNFKIALEEFNKVVNQYPKSSKVSDAKLKIGFSYYELENWKQARASLSDVTRRYPKSRVAKSAERRLARMKQEGH
ncbi:MAG: tol-pal system protein YbgF [Gammaproteobacteria bacterium]|nr:MAG: tol-pal system protein YbgF [Gammaproteobacteria bacterium]